MSKHKLVLAPPNEMIRSNLKEGTVLTLFWTAPCRGCLIQVPRISRVSLRQALDEAYRAMKTSTPPEQIKIVGNSEAVHSLTGTLSALRLPMTSSAIREEKHIEVLFYTETGRLRVQSTPEAAREPAPAPMQASESSPIKVLIVDDSSTIRKLLTTVLSQDPGLEVVGSCEKPSQVAGAIQKLRPDVLTLDIHMPEMDGVTLLKTLMPRFRIPAVMITSVSREEGPMVFDALENGAVDYIQKPSLNELAILAPMIVEKVKTAAKARIQTPSHLSAAPAQWALSGQLDSSCLIAIGSSTGGTEALKKVLTRLPSNIPPIVIVQHIPPVFSLAFAKRMNELCPFEVKEGEHGDAVVPGRAIIAPGGKQMKLERVGKGLRIVIDDSPPVNRHKPSVDYLFDSVAETVGKHSIGLILTGMGGDGAKGLLKMRQKGSRTLAQDEASCVVFGMPKEAIRLGAAQETCHLLKIPEQLMKWLEKKSAA